MFITPDQAKKLTNKELSADLIFRAQNIIESYAGKVEADIKSGKDKILMARSTAYQAAYMKDNEELVYEQMAVVTSGAGTQMQTLDTKKDAPWIAPLAVLTLKYLSFNRSRSYRTGRIFQYPPAALNWRYE